MKYGRSLQELAAELDRQANSRKDYIAPQGAVEAKVLEGEVVVDGLNGGPITIGNYAHGQLSDFLEIPRRYYDRMRGERPALLATNINTWLHKEPENQRMFRTIDRRLRGFLSPKFRPLDNFPLASAVLPTLIERKAQIISAELTETRLYIKAILPDLSIIPDDVTFGEGHTFYGAGKALVAALVISNSEFGAGTLRVEPSIWTEFCTNLAILKQVALRKYHVGRASAADEGFEIFEDDTRKADDSAFWLKVRDVTKAAFNPEQFQKAIEGIKEAGRARIDETADLTKVVDLTVKTLSLPQSSSSSILNFLAKGGDLSKWGLSSAITSAAGDQSLDYEVATTLERAGGEMLALPASQWEPIAKAA